MALNDNAVLTAAVGYVFVAAPGTARPTPAELKTLDPITFGSETQILKLTGAPTGGSFTLTAGTGATATTADIPFDANHSDIQDALEGVAAVGKGNVLVSGDINDATTGLSVAWVGTLQGKSLTLTSTTTKLTGGTTPALTVTPGAKKNNWVQIGHTSRGDMPELGFEGGKTELRGSWQNEALREVQTEAAADFVALWLFQIDTDAFELYYGKNSSKTEGVFGVAGGAAKPIEKALLIIIVDGDRRVGFYAPKASIKRDDSIDMPVDDFTALPIKATLLKYGGSNKMEWIAESFHQPSITP